MATQDAGRTTSPALLFLQLLLFLALVEASLSLKEWKKFENGIVQSESHESAQTSEDKNDNKEEGTAATNNKQQHILHNHHGEKLNHHKQNSEQQHEDIQWETSEQVPTPKPIKDRHHRKNAEKMLHASHRGEGKRHPIAASYMNTAGDDQVQPTTKEDSKDSDQQIKSGSSKWSSKPEGMSTMQWRRMQKDEERRKLEKAKIIAESWLNKTDYLHTQKNKKKKHVIKRMEGNKMAKKVWKEAFRGPDRLVLK